MTFSHLPACLTTFFRRLACALDPRIRQRFVALLKGALFARGRRTVTTWVRAAELSDDFRRAYTTIAASGRHVRFQGPRPCNNCGPCSTAGACSSPWTTPPRPATARACRGAGLRPGE